MNIAETIRNGIPKIGTSFMSKTFYDDFHSTPKKLYQVIGYGDCYGYLKIHVVMDNFKTLKIEKYPLSNFLSMKLKRTAPFINEMSIKKTTLMEKNKFYLNPYGILYTHSDRCSLLVNGIALTVIRKRIETIKDDNRIYEVTDMESVKKILEKQRNFLDEISLFYVDDEKCFDELIKKSINYLLDDYYTRFASTFLMNKVITYKLLEIVEKNEQQGLI